MKSEMRPSHVAVLVPSVRGAADYLGQFNFQIGEEESFEETREIYVQGDDQNSLLLMEAKETGSYKRAIEKRGPGLHHLAIDVLNLENFLGTLSGSGWLLQLNSLRTLKDFRTVYLARPGFPALIEVQEKKSLLNKALFVTEVFLKLEASQQHLVNSIGLGEIVKSTPNNPRLALGGKSIDLKNLF